MKFKTLLCLLSTISILQAMGATAQNDSPDPYANETSAERDARMKWWREARFGMFIHWGVYSVPAGTYHDKQIGGIGEWIMNTGKIPCAEYQEYSRQFTPVKFNAEEWVKLARDAGMKYIVITAKHHDGFAMFDSKASDWNIVKASPYAHDPLKDLAAACKKYNVRLGFYYSQAQDWNNPGGAAAGGHWDKAQDGDMTDYIKRVAAPQLREILSNYGPISVLWWDTPENMTRERAEVLLPILKLQPGIIHNNRLGGGFGGDTETPEQFIPSTGYKGRDWETCMTMNDTWGFKSYDNNWKSTETLVRNLVDIASKGGNYLLNVGPTSEGLIPAPSVERLKEVATWMKANGDAIYGTTASPFKRLNWGRCTTKVNKDGATLYLHVFAWPKDGSLVVPGLRNEVASAKLLANGTMLKTSASSEGLTIKVPSDAPDKISSTIVLKVKGALNIEVPTLAQDSNGKIVLAANDAVLHGEQVRCEGAAPNENIGYWTRANEWVEWSFKVTQPGQFVVTAEMASLANPSFKLTVGDKTLDAKAPETGDYKKYQKAELGTIDLSAGDKVVLSVRPVEDGWQPFNLRNITIQPK